MFEEIAGGVYRFIGMISFCILISISASETQGKAVSIHKAVKALFFGRGFDALTVP